MKGACHRGCVIARVIVAVILSASLVGTLCGCTAISAVNPAQGLTQELTHPKTPTDTVEEFVAALNRYDIDEMRGFLDFKSNIAVGIAMKAGDAFLESLGIGGITTEDLFKDFVTPSVQSGQMNWRVDGSEYTEKIVDDGHVLVTFLIEAQINEGGSVSRVKDYTTLSLVKEQGGWKVDLFGDTQ